MIAIMDYGIGNLGSVKNALDYLGFENVITSDKDIILNADKVYYLVLVLLVMQLIHLKNMALMK